MNLLEFNFETVTANDKSMKFLVVFNVKLISLMFAPNQYFIHILPYPRSTVCG